MTKYIYEQLNYKEHVTCPNCSKLMIKRMSTEIDAILREGDRKVPAKEWWYWCNCGCKETGGILKGMSETTWIKQEWEKVNNIERLPESNGVDK